MKFNKLLLKFYSQYLILFLKLKLPNCIKQNKFKFYYFKIKNVKNQYQMFTIESLSCDFNITIDTKIIRNTK